MSKGKRVIIVGLDGASLSLIRDKSAEGSLPTFKRMLDEGTYGELESTIPFVTIPAWPSFATGTNPGKHGLFDFFKECDDTYDPRVITQPSREVRMPTLWHVLSEYEKRVAVINVPSTFPPSPVNGYMITGMLTPPGAKYTYPAEFERELIDNVGSYSVFSSTGKWKGDVSRLLSDCVNALEERLRATHYLLAKGVDFLMFVDNGTDRAGHELWRYTDDSSPLFDPEESERCGDLLLKYYQEVDRGLEAILDNLTQDDVIFIMSDHGMGPVWKFISLNTFLIQQGFMRIRKGLLSRFRYFSFKRGWNLDNLDKLLRKLQLDRYISRNLSDQMKSSLVEKVFFSSRDIDWNRTTAYALGVPGGIRVNLKGREPEGTVMPGAEYEETVNDLMAKLREMRDPATGERLVDKVYRREEIYHGSHIGKASDIIATPSNRYEFYRAYRFPFSKVVQSTSGHSGSHRLNGTFIAMGNGMRKGLQVSGANIMDLTPTVLHIMNVPVPENMDGRVLREIFEPTGEPGMREPRYIESERESEKIGEEIRKLKKLRRL